MATAEERLSVCEANDANIFHQLDELKGEVKDLRRLTVAVEKIADRMETIDTKVTNIDKRIYDIESEPKETYKYIKQIVIASIVTGLIGAILGAILTLILK